MSGFYAFFENASYWPLALTVTVFCGTMWLQRKTKLAFLNPIMLAAILIYPILLLTHTTMEAYQKGTQVLSFLLTPATICLGLSLYTQLQKLKNDLPAILIGVTAGVLTSLGTVLFIGILCGMERTLILSVLPKSVTTAIGLALSEEGGGIPSLTTAVIVVTGALGHLAGGAFCKLLHITDPIARGVAYGTTSHVIGTTRAAEESVLTGAVSSLSLAIAGLLTAVLFPLAARLIG